ncbi:hypothetical protein BCR41DRAFT_348891 [Lobosporangium transversale]|uniref:Uncharacterized protein n=1 Tax=Lobosporangium transversale TaxID=64571 RepID=A0A1Y2GV92_9FUNG|nr:hypothetical protein BCR41DRAFT_348891 [Lobosporangium transversale]ORZ25010.1 hypothetical protein BCR41DRAFT_348891 [Lobosporangium transversale]|eukprot:XP_021883991.1 hypothetical protein BCR41DRAFT_348891 [Lobosporangium transversale]
MKLSQSSKVVIEITQPRHRAFESSRSRSSSLAAAFGSAPAPFYPQQQYGGGKLLRHAISQPNMLIHSTSSILGQRRSASPDEEGMVLGSSKKHCAGSLSGPKEEERGSGDINKSNDDDASAIFTGRATSIVAGNPTQKQRGIPTLSTTASAFIRPQTTGLNSTHKDGHAAGYKDKIGLDVRVALYGSNSETDVEPKYTASANEGKSTVGSPMIEALGVAKASSCMKFEHQKELGIDYSFFTRVETAGWRILIPPNVVASFRSEDFGLTLKPKVVDAGVGLGKNGSSVVANDTDPIAISGGSVPTTAAIQKMEMGCSFESAPLVYEEVDDVGMMEINGKNQIEDEATQSIKNDDDMVEAGSHVQGTTATNLAAAVEEIGEEGMREEEMATMVESPIVQPQITSEDDQEMDELED